MCNILACLLAFAAIAVATPTSPDLAARSITPSILKYTKFLASQGCDFTSTTNEAVDKQCLDFTPEVQSYQFNEFHRGTDFIYKVCYFNVFSGRNCSGVQILFTPAHDLPKSCFIGGSDVSFNFYC